MIEDEVLLRDYEATGSPRAFEKIVALHRAHVLTICTRITGNAHDAEDGTQAVFLTLAMQARGGNSIHSLRPWLSQVARHVSLDLCKARKRRIAHESSARRSEDLLPQSSPVDQEELQRLVREQIDKLPTRYRTPMILFYFGGMSLPVMGRQLNVSRKALGVRLLRARRMLAERLARMNYPWVAIALVPAMVESAIRYSSPMSSIHATTAAAPLAASALPNWLQAGLPIRQGRRVLAAITCVTLIGSMAGSATLAWGPQKFPLPSIDAVGSWTSKLLRRFTPTFRTENVAPVKAPKTTSTTASQQITPHAIASASSGGYAVPSPGVFQSPVMTSPKLGASHPSIQPDFNWQPNHWTGPAQNGIASSSVADTSTSKIRTAVNDQSHGYTGGGSSPREPLAETVALADASLQENLAAGEWVTWATLQPGVAIFDVASLTTSNRAGLQEYSLTPGGDTGIASSDLDGSAATTIAPMDPTTPIKIDIGSIDPNLIDTATNLPATGGTIVPEPAAIATLVLGAGLLLRRRRRG